MTKPKWILTPLHKWVTVDKSVIAEWQKGERETIQIRGDYQECETCPAGQFVPESPHLSIVPCTKVK